MPVIAKVLYLDKNWQDKIDPVPKISERHLVEMEDFADSLARPKTSGGQKAFCRNSSAYLPCRYRPSKCFSQPPPPHPHPFQLPLVLSCCLLLLGHRSLLYEEYLVHQKPCLFNSVSKEAWSSCFYKQQCRYETLQPREDFAPGEARLQSS